MSKLGFLVVSKEGYLASGQSQAAKIFDDIHAARKTCTISKKKIVPLVYEDAVTSLLAKAAFCFDGTEAHGRFLKRLRNDPAHKIYWERSQDREFVQWIDQAPAPPAGSVAPLDSTPESLEPVSQPVGFNPSILVR
jgi:hypothetical protein